MSESRLMQQEIKLLIHFKVLPLCQQKLFITLGAFVSDTICDTIKTTVTEEKEDKKSQSADHKS